MMYYIYYRSIKSSGEHHVSGSGYNFFKSHGWGEMFGFELPFTASGTIATTYPTYLVVR